MYNDAEFTREDWAGIISPRLGSQKKKSAEKVGKFGLGFSSVYHVTDCPWVMSGQLVRMIDPQQLYQNKDFMTWDLSKQEARNQWTSRPDQMEPWKVC